MDTHGAPFGRRGACGVKGGGQARLGAAEQRRVGDIGVGRVQAEGGHRQAGIVKRAPSARLPEGTGRRPARLAAPTASGERGEETVPYTTHMPTLTIGRRPAFARVAALDRDRARGVPPDHTQNLRVANALLAEARALGAWPPEDPLGGLDADIRVARAFNVRHPPR